MATYREEVIKPGDAASKLAKQVNRESYGNSPAITVLDEEDSSGFRNPVGFVWREHILREMLEQSQHGSDWQIGETTENDGNGGKPQFFTLMGSAEAFFGHGWDLIAMTNDDLARSGRFGVMMLSNEVNVKRATDSNFHLIEAMFKGFGAALRKSRLVSITGEFAVMKYSITAFCDAESDHQLILTWGGTCHGLMRRDRLINNANIKPGMVVVGFWEPGYRCNGGSRLTQILLDLHGGKVSDLMHDRKTMEFARKLTIPSQSYAFALNRVQGWLPDGSVRMPLAQIVGAAHITGGGLWGKFGETLPQGVGAVLDSMPQPSEVLLKAQELSRQTANALSDWECHDIFHGGCGMLVVCPDIQNATILINEAVRDRVVAQVVGRTVESDNSRITVHSRFADRKVLNSDEPPSF